MAPDAALAVNLAKAMMQQHIAGSRRVRTGPGADNAVKAEQRLDRVAFEPAIEDLGRRTGEEIEHVAARVEGQFGKPPAQRRRLQKFRDRREPAAIGDIGRGLEQQVAQHAGGIFEHPVVTLERFGVAGRKLRHRGPGHARSGLQRPPVRQGQKIAHPPLDDLEPVAVQFQIGDHLGIEQRHRVGGDGIAEAGMKFLGDRGAADRVVLFKDRNLVPGRRQIPGADQPVVAAADHHRMLHIAIPRFVRVSSCTGNRDRRNGARWSGAGAQDRPVGFFGRSFGRAILSTIAVGRLAMNFRCRPASERATTAQGNLMSRPSSTR